MEEIDEVRLISEQLVTPVACQYDFGADGANARKGGGHGGVIGVESGKLTVPDD